MLFKYFKNGNIHVKYENDFDDYRYFHSVNVDMIDDDPTYADMCCVIYNSELDAICYSNYDAYFSTIAIVNHVCNDATYDYVIPYDELYNFFNGKWIVLRHEGLHAFVKIPSFHDCYKVTIKDIDYTLYKLNEKPSDEFITDMQYHGCLFKCVSPMYAPEIMHCAMLVPYGAPIEF